MATASQPTITMDEYLHTAYRPDCDYVDGELQERNMGELDHGEVQGAIVEWFRRHGKDWNIRTIPELRIRVSPSRVRVADVCLLARAEATEQVPTRPPMVVIEILSPEDRVSRYEQRIDDYRKMGVRHLGRRLQQLRAGPGRQSVDPGRCLRARLPAAPRAAHLRHHAAAGEDQE